MDMSEMDVVAISVSIILLDLGAVGALGSLIITTSTRQLPKSSHTLTLFLHRHPSLV